MKAEIDELVERAAERRKNGCNRHACSCQENAEADLDRAIALAYSENAAKERIRRGVERAMKGQNTG